MTLPPHQSEKSLANKFASFFHQKIKRIPNEDLQNYRLVSGLCFMSKLVEKVVVKQLMQHINSNNLDNPRQSA